MEKIIVELEAKTNKALKGIDNVAKSVSDLNKEVVSSNKKTAESLNGIQKVTKTVTKGVKGLGTGLKALGLGLIISSLDTLKDLFSQNQKVVDLFTTAFEFAGQMVSQVTTAVTDIYDALTQTTDQFDALGKVISGVVTIGLTPLKLTFYGIKLAVQEAMLAWENSFLGGKDEETIKQLNLSITETRTNLLDVGKAALNAGKDIVDNFGEAVTEVGDAGKIVAKELGEVNVKSALESAKAITELKKSAELASVLNQGLIEQYDRQAEQLRQIRDDDSKSIEERIKANEELALVLDEQEVAMKKNAQIAVDAAAAELSKNKDSIELQKAYQDALNEQAGIEAQITGFRSEQQTNTNSLLKEQKEIMNEISLFGKSERDKERLELQQEYDLNKELIEREVTDDAEKKERLLALQTDFNTRLKEINDGFDAEDIETKQKNTDESNRIAKEQKDFKEEQYQKGYSDLQNIVSIGGKKLEKVGKALAIADVVRSSVKSISETVSSTGVANAKAVAASPLTGGMPFVGINTVKAALSIGSTIASATKSIQSIKGNAKTVSPQSIPSNGGGGGASVPPAFNVVGASDTNQLADAIGGQSKQPSRAYVVASDVSTAQALDRNIITESGT
jgi:virulence-associated protein VapD